MFQVIVNFFLKFIREFYLLTYDMAIYLLLGFFFAGILHSFLPEGFVSRHVGKRGVLSSLKAALFGVPLPLCSCGVVPTSLSLKKSGASKGAVVSFLISTPQTGFDSIAATYSLLGGLFAIFRVVVAFITGVIGGILTDLFVNKEENSNEIDEAKNGYCSSNCEVNIKIENTHSLKNRIKSAYEYGFGELVSSIARWIVMGLFIGALISTIIPDSFFTTYLENGVITYLIVLIVSIPVYVCATGSIPIAASLILKGISPGAAFIFLMAGPATNSVTFTVLYKTIGKKATFIYLSTIIAGSILGGALIDLFFMKSMVSAVIKRHSISHFSILKVLGAILLVALLLKALFFKYFKKEKGGSEMGFDVKKYMVEGMTCNHCKMTISKIVEKLEGVKNYSVSLEEKILTVEGSFDESLLFSLIEEAGYGVKPLKKG